MLRQLKKIYRKYRGNDAEAEKQRRISGYINNGREPWSDGYIDYRWDAIKNAINDETVLQAFKSGTLASDFGFRIDERIVEYPWIISNLNGEGKKLLDAGSTLNYEPLIGHARIKSKELTIYTFHPEKNNFQGMRVSYVFGDLREMPFKDACFNEIICQSTIEHVDMDNSIYGYDLEHSATTGEKSHEYMKVVDELLRVLAPGGQLLLTFPYGKYENHGFFQQFDREMTEKLTSTLEVAGTIETEFFKYQEQGWQCCAQDVCDDSISFNPHSGKGKGDDGAAHCRAVCCINFLKSK